MQLFEQLNYVYVQQKVQFYIFFYKKKIKIKNIKINFVLLKKKKNYNSFGLFFLTNLNSVNLYNFFLSTWRRKNKLKITNKIKNFQK